MKTLSFYKREGLWYADLPEYIEAGGSEEDCLMISGADTWLDMLAEGASRISVRISIKEILPEKINLLEKDESGGTYIASTYKGKSYAHQLWLCPVTLFVLGDYPGVIYYEKME
jgi:hypothetical protein